MLTRRNTRGPPNLLKVPHPAHCFSYADIPTLPPRDWSSFLFYLPSPPSFPNNLPCCQISQLNLPSHSTFMYITDFSIQLLFNVDADSTFRFFDFPTIQHYCILNSNLVLLLYCLNLQYTTSVSKKPYIRIILVEFAKLKKPKKDGFGTPFSTMEGQGTPIHERAPCTQMLKAPPHISSDLHFSVLYSIIVDLFYQAFSIVNLFTYFIAFLNIFSNILTTLCWVYNGRLINVGPRK